MSNSNEEIKHSIRSLPKKPGVYQFFDRNDKLIYVGKAKVLKNRVSSYFSGAHDSGKTRLLVKNITRLEYIVVETEFDALLLENTLIKEHQPRFNIQLRDDKTYPWICIKKERFPRVFSTRNQIKDGSEYFGPYASVRMMKTLLELIHRLYKTRTCSYNLSQENIEAGKFRLCLEYQIGNCLGPCENKQSEEDYNQQIAQIRKIIKGDLNGVISILKNNLEAQVASLQFELAHETKERIDLLEKYQSKSTVVHPTIHDVDVYSIVEDAQAGFVNFMKIASGAIVQSQTIEIRKKLDESGSELLASAIAELRDRFQSTSKELICSTEPEVIPPNTTCHVPQRGDKKKLLELSLRNAKYYMVERYKQLERVDPDRHTNRLLETIQKDLRLTALPVHMECFDNSNFQGAFPVAACVVFKNGKPAKKDYRHFDIKTVVGPDDFASMTEVVHRRYKRLIDEGEDLPQLVVIDGGKGQLSAALEAFDLLGIRGKVAIIGIAKRLEEIYFPGDSTPIYLDKRSESLKVIQQMRNEAHRFGITHHRNKRSKAGTKSELHGIKGIGPKTAEEILKHFRSVKRARQASEEELAKIVGPSKAKIVSNYFKSSS